MVDRQRRAGVAELRGTRQVFRDHEYHLGRDEQGRPRVEFQVGRVHHSLVLEGGHRLDGRLSSGLGAGMDGCLSIRPEQIRMSREAMPAGLEVVVHNRIFLGEHTEYLVRHPALGSLIVLAPRQMELDDRGFATGDKAFVSWSRDSARVLERD